MYKQILIIILSLIGLFVAFSVLSLLVALLGPRSSLIRSKLFIGAMIVAFNSTLIGCEQGKLSERNGAPLDEKQESLQGKNSDLEGTSRSGFDTSQQDDTSYPSDTATEEFEQGDAGMDGGTDGGGYDDDGIEDCYDGYDPRPADCDCNTSDNIAKRGPASRLVGFLAKILSR